MVRKTTVAAWSKLFDGDAAKIRQINRYFGPSMVRVTEADWPHPVHERVPDPRVSIALRWHCPTVVPPMHHSTRFYHRGVFSTTTLHCSQRANHTHTHSARSPVVISPVPRGEGHRRPVTARPGAGQVSSRAPRDRSGSGAGHRQPITGTHAWPGRRSGLAAGATQPQRPVMPPRGQVANHPAPLSSGRWQHS